MSINVSDVDFIAIATKDIGPAVDFYENVLGLEKTVQWGQMPAYEFETGNVTLAVMQSDAFGQEFKASGAPLALQVEDVAAARAELEGKGVQFRADTIDSGVCHMAIFSDPDGNPLILHHRYSPRES